MVLHLLSVFTLVLPLLYSITRAAPSINLQDRVFQPQKRNTRDNPIPVTIDITGWEDIAEFDCWEMLCREGGNRVYQRHPRADGNQHNYRDSGASFRPFHDDELTRRNTAQITPETISAEEWPPEHTTQGGRNAAVFPATELQQQRQGIVLAAMLEGVDRGDWYRLTFTPSSAFGQYCTALHSEPPDFSVCTKKKPQTLFGKAGVVLAAFAFQVVKSGATPYKFIPASTSIKSVRDVQDVALD